MARIHAALSRDYDRIARLVDQRLGLYARQTMVEALKLADLKGTEAVLDACSGTGELLQLIALREHRGPLYGVDFSQTMMNVAHHRLKSYPNINLKQEDVTAFRLPSDYFHVILNTNALHYLTNPQRTFQEFHRLLRPHGRLIITDLAANSRLTRLWSQLRRLVRPSYAHLYQLDEVTELLKKAGFTMMRKKLLRVNVLWSVMLIEAQRPAPNHRRPPASAEPKTEAAA